MDARTLRRFITEARPFRFALTTGEIVRVPHGDWASLAPSGRTLLVWQDNAPAIYDVALIEKVEPSLTRKKTAS